MSETVVDTGGSQNPVANRSLRPLLHTVLLDVALLSATVLSGLRVVYGVVKMRKLDPFAAYLLLTFGLSLAVGLATTDPKLILVGNTIVNGIGGLIFLGSCVIGRPLTQVIDDRFRPEDAGDEIGPSVVIRRAPALPAPAPA